MAERSALAAALGLALGFLASRMLFLQWATLIPWAVGGLILGAICRDWRQALVSGAAFGFMLGFSFSAFGYGGADPILGKLPFFALLGAMSAAFGVALSLAGWRLRLRLRGQSGGRLRDT